MLAVIATFRVLLDQPEAFEALYSPLGEVVRTNEPATRLDRRLRTEAGAHKFLDLCEDEAALEAHMRSGWLKAAAPNPRPILEGLPGTMPVMFTPEAVGLAAPAAGA